MRYKPNFLSLFLFFLVVLSVSHLIVHLTFYGTGVHGFAERGISGFAVEGEKLVGGSMPISEIILFLEWGAVFLVVITVYSKHRIDLKKELGQLKALKESKHFSEGTELDNFYELLKDAKHFRLATAAQVFDVDLEVVEDWSKSLESGKFAELTYPRIGGPEIKIIEEVKPEKVKPVENVKVMEKNKEGGK